MKAILGNGKVANVIKNSSDIIISHSEIEITDLSSVDSQLSKLPKNTVVVNTAAKISLEWCEDNKQLAYDTNTLGALNVAKICQKYSHHLVHISSGCIFDGGETEKYYSEDDDPTPAAWYAETKAEADRKILGLGYEKVTIVRPRQLISSIPHPTNMLTKFLGINSGKFIDSKNSITCIEDMKEMIDHLCSKNFFGIYNLVNLGHVSPLEIATKLKIIKKDLDVEKIDYLDYLKTLRVKRVNTLLDVTKLMSTGYKPRSANLALDWCLKHYGKT